MIRHGSIWTTSKELEFAQVMYSEEKYDDKKRIHYCDVRCEVCQQMVGMYYLQKPGNSPVDNSPEGHDSSMVKSLFASPSSTHPMGSKESMLSYPCAKILYLRQSASGVIFNKTLLLGEKHSIENAIDLLLQQGKPHNNQEGSGSNSNHSKQHLALLSP